MRGFAKLKKPSQAHLIAMTFDPEKPRTTLYYNKSCNQYGAMLIFGFPRFSDIQWTFVEHFLDEFFILSLLKFGRSGWLSHAHLELPIPMATTTVWAGGGTILRLVSKVKVPNDTLNSNKPIETRLISRGDSWRKNTLSWNLMAHSNTKLVRQIPQMFSLR